MILTNKERDVVASVCPFPLTGIPEDELGDVLDAWFADDHFDDNPVYSWDDTERMTG